MFNNIQMTYHGEVCFDGFIHQHVSCVRREGDGEGLLFGGDDKYSTTTRSHLECNYNEYQIIE